MTTMKTTRWLITALLLVVLVLVSCRKGPDTEALRREVQAKLDRSFQKGLFKITSLTRKGHYPYREEGDDQQRLLIYYNAEIELLRDYRLSDWDKLNVGSLISVLGATPHGVEGVKPKGNVKGDRLEVRGSCAFAGEEGKWSSVAFLPASRGDKKRPDTDKDLLPYRRHLKKLGEIGASFQTGKDRSSLDFLNSRLAELMADAERRLGRSKGWLTLATGSTSGEYYRQGKGLEKVLKRAGHETRVYQTSGSIENCRLVERREVLFGYTQNDVAHMGHGGTEMFEEQIPLKNLRALCSLYPEAVQIVTLKGSGVRRLQELQGKRINIGPRGSGARVNALQLLRGVDLSLRDFSEVQLKSIPEAIKELAAKKIDAFFLTSAIPNPALYKMAGKTPVDLVPLDQETVAKLRERHPYFLPLEVPPNTYPGMKAKRLTVQVTAMLITHRDTPGKRVETLLSQLFANVAALSKGSLQAYFISPRTALSGVSIPLHPAAERYLKRTRADK